jgi:hypothetical protein
MAALQNLKVIRPTSEKCAVALPVRKPNAAYRSREHLTEREVERLVEAAKDNRWGHREGRPGERHPARPESQTGHSSHAPADRS